MLRLAFLILTVAVSIQARAVETMTSKPLGAIKGLVIIAPAKKYLMQERLFSSLAENLAIRGFLTIRFNWSEDTPQISELELQRAERDIQNVILNAQKTYGFQSDQTTLITKSFSTKAIGHSLALAKNHILLTPNCSVEAPFQKTYSNVLNDSNIQLKMIISVDDPYCNVNEIYETLNSLGRSQLLATTKGDHNFIVIEQSTGSASYVFQDFVSQYVAELVSRQNSYNQPLKLSEN